MKDTERIVKQMRDNPKGVKFDDLCKVCDCYLGEARSKGIIGYTECPGKAIPE
jgi:hypothetical protein